MAYDLRPGLRVYTHAAIALGTIVTVQDAFFKVAAVRRPDFWVRTADVIAETHARDGVMLRRNAKHYAAPEGTE